MSNSHFPWVDMTFGKKSKVQKTSLWETWTMHLVQRKRKTAQQNKHSTALPLIVQGLQIGQQLLFPASSQLKRTSIVNCTRFPVTKSKNIVPETRKYDKEWTSFIGHQFNTTCAKFISFLLYILLLNLCSRYAYISLFHFFFLFFLFFERAGLSCFGVHLERLQFGQRHQQEADSQKPCTIGSFNRMSYEEKSASKTFLGQRKGKTMTTCDQKRSSTKFTEKPQ